MSINLKAYLNSTTPKQERIIKEGNKKNWTVLDVKLHCKSDEFTNETYIIISKRGSKFCTHQAYICNQTSQISFGSGHYDMSFKNAVLDFEAR